MALFRVPSMLLKRLYTYGSLRNTPEGVRFSIKNRLNDAKITGFHGLWIDGIPVPEERITLDFGDGQPMDPAGLNREGPVAFPLGKEVTILARVDPLAEGKHAIRIRVQSSPFGTIDFTVEDAIAKEVEVRARIPRSQEDDYSAAIIQERQRFVEEFTSRKLEHIPHYSFDPHIVKGNCENFTGVAQVPIGFAGPITIHGEYAQGEFIVPMATTEGTLVASYNRGMKVLNLSGGVKCTVLQDAMQRAPVFVFDDARGAREFVGWIRKPEVFARIQEEAESTSRVARLKEIDAYLANKFAFLRFNYLTGDAAGQNMAGRATFAACSWILDNYEGIRAWYLESNFATDKKASQVNIMRTRGKRVVAEAVVKRDVLVQFMRVTPEQLFYHYNVANIGSILSGANNNGLHSANAITAIFIATGQDVANVAESSAGLLYAEVTQDGDLYLSITIPSLIVATYGGGTGLATQRECLELMGCYGAGKVYKFAEIVAGTVLAGEISLASAISALDWVSSHEQYGRNR